MKGVGGDRDRQRGGGGGGRLTETDKTNTSWLEYPLEGTPIYLVVRLVKSPSLGRT